MLHQEAEARYKQYFAECVKDDMFNIYLSSSVDERKEFCNYAPKEFKNSLQEIDKLLSIQEEGKITEEHINAAADAIFDMHRSYEESKYLECKTDNTNQVDSLHNNTIGKDANSQNVD